MPLTLHGERMKKRMEREYGEEKGDEVLYASKNAGKPGFTNIDRGQKRHHKRHGRKSTRE